MSDPTIKHVFDIVRVLNPPPSSPELKGRLAMVIHTRPIHSATSHVTSIIAPLENAGTVAWLSDADLETVTSLADLINRRP